MIKIRKKPLEFTDFIAKLYPELINIDSDKKTLSKVVTFQVTDACNLACTYCYQINKGTRVMSFEVAKKFIDLLLSGEKGFSDYIGVNNTPGLILDFIGGEPLLEVELIDKIIDYFRAKALELDHPWAEKYKCSISSNGVLYFDPKVQKFLNKHKEHLSFSISIDGNKELHDSCRVFPDGRPSYDIAIAGAMDWIDRGNYMGSKITVAPANVSHIYEASKHMIELGYYDININCVFEDGWTIDHAKILYQQLKKFADYLLSLDDTTEYYYAFFKEDSYKPIPESENNNWCGGDGSMLAVDPDGVLYPCIRYMESSLGENQTPIIIGNVDNGIAATQEIKDCIHCMQCITRRSQSTDECFYCKIGQGCSWCFPRGTMINTPYGMTDIADLKISDLVLDMNGQVQEVENVLSRMATDLVTIKAAGLHDMITTSEHPFLTKKVIKRHHNIPIYSEPMWIRAGDLEVTDKIALYVPRLGNISFNKNLAYLLGRYIGDGWKTTSIRPNPFRYYICCSMEEKEKLEWYLDESLVLYNGKKNKAIMEYYINTESYNSKVLIELLDKCGRYAYDKQVPPEVYTWDAETVNAFLTGYFDADGYFDNRKGQRYTTVSQKLVYQIAELCRAVYHKNVTITERHPDPTTVIEGRTVNQSYSYEGSFKPWDLARSFYEYDEENNMMWVNVRAPILQPPTRMQVFNLTVKNNPTFIANGAIVHNCSAYNYQVFGTVDKRATFICEMHKAASLANVYFWSKLYKKYNMDKKIEMHCPKEWAIPIIGEEEYNMLYELQK